jgi:hypothetical protein
MNELPPNVSELLLRMRRSGAGGKKFAEQLLALLETDPGLKKRIPAKDLAMLMAWKHSENYAGTMQLHYLYGDQFQEQPPKESIPGFPDYITEKWHADEMAKLPEYKAWKSAFEHHHGLGSINKKMHNRRPFEAAHNALRSAWQRQLPHIKPPVQHAPESMGGLFGQQSFAEMMHESWEDNYVAPVVYVKEDVRTLVKEPEAPPPSPAPVPYFQQSPEPQRGLAGLIAEIMEYIKPQPTTVHLHPNITVQASTIPAPVVNVKPQINVEQAQVTVRPEIKVEAPQITVQPSKVMMPASKSMTTEILYDKAGRVTGKIERPTE